MGMRSVAIVSLAVGAILTTSSASRMRAAQPVHEINVVAKKFAFEPAEIQVVAGEPMRLLIRSADTTHGFSIKQLKIDLQIPKGGEPVAAEFIAPPAGRYEIACSEFCGSGHGRMKAALVSVASTDNARPQ
jgi:cytochrome c oxidase subunit 2